MIKIANAPCSWGVLEFGIAGEVAGFAQVLNEMHDAGYAGTELGDYGFLPTDPIRLKDELQARNLELVGGFVPVGLRDRSKHQAGIDHGLKVASLMADAGFPDALVILADENGSVSDRTKNAGRITPDLYLSAEDWRAFAYGAEQFAQSVLDNTGLRTAFHHHCGGYVETPGEVERFLTLTKSDLIGLVLDMGHYRYGGGYPEAAIRLFADRVWHVHYKDCSTSVVKIASDNAWDYFTAVRQGVFCELGQGSVDFRDITGVLSERDYEGWIVVEQDVLPGMGNPRECANQNREFLRSLGL